MPAQEWPCLGESLEPAIALEIRIDQSLAQELIKTITTVMLRRAAALTDGQCAASVSDPIKLQFELATEHDFRLDQVTRVFTAPGVVKLIGTDGTLSHEAFASPVASPAAGHDAVPCLGPTLVDPSQILRVSAERVSSQPEQALVIKFDSKTGQEISRVVVDTQLTSLAICLDGVIYAEAGIDGQFDRYLIYLGLAETEVFTLVAISAAKLDAPDPQAAIEIVFPP